MAGRPLVLSKCHFEMVEIHCGKSDDRILGGWFGVLLIQTEVVITAVVIMHPTQTQPFAIIN